MADPSTVRNFADYLAVGEAAKVLGVSPWTLRNWDQSGKLKPIRHPISGHRMYGRDQLESLLKGSGPVSRARSLTPSVTWDEIGPAEHMVQFYESDRFLVESVTDYVAHGLDRGEGVLIIATQDHRRRIRRKLKHRGLDLPAARKRGQCVALDAEKALASFMNGDTPDATRFEASLGSLVAELAGRWRRIWAFGEMVSLLWTAGNREAAYRIEELWNDLAKWNSFSLLCSYPLNGFHDETNGQSLAGICGCHSRVIPAESYSGLTTSAEQLRTIALLQQKAARLEAEIPDRKQANRDRAMLAAIIESSDDAIVSKTLEGIIRTWNAGAERLFGYTESEVVGKPITIIIPPERHQEETEILRRLRRGERIEHFETVRVAKDGRRMDISLTISPLRNSGGKLVGASKIARDITARKQSEAALRESEERYRRLAELLPVGVYTCRAPSGTITYFNRQAAELWGREPAIGESVERFCGSLRLFLPDGTCLPHDQCPMAIAIREGRSYRNQEVQFERPDGSRITALVNIDPVRDSSGRVVGAVNVFQDVSSLKEAEMALKEADRRKDEFLATLAHELRNPLAPISNGLQILRIKGQNAPPDDGVREIHDMIERQTSHMVRLIDDLLEFSRINRGRIKLKKENVRLRSVIDHAVETSKPLIEAGKHALIVRLPEDEIAVNGDAVRLSQILSNLLNNAAKYTDPGGTITITARREGGEAVVSVRDTGIGIPRNQLARVFDLFSQIESPLRRSQDGLGIGLSLVQSLVQLHGGSVTADSAGLGQGSEFVVRLPALGDETPVRDGSTGHERCGSDGGNAADGGTGHRILVVDDNRDAADSLGSMLKCLGGDVHIVYDAPSALDAIRICRPSVVFMDLGMPGMNGYELARRIRQDAKQRDITLIALTGWGQEEDRRRSRKAGLDHHLVKPVDISALQVLFAACGVNRTSANQSSGALTEHVAG